jgi:hypothetical protein
VLESASNNLLDWTGKHGISFFQNLFMLTPPSRIAFESVVYRSRRKITGTPVEDGPVVTGFLL